jgi:rubrerythrin
MSAVVYTRVPEQLKQALEARARERGLSVNATVCELLERGLEAIGDERSGKELEGKLAASASELEKTRARLKQAEFGLQAAREREQLTARTYAAFAERARRELASCPQCRKPLRGSDLLVSGHCPNCDKALTSLLVPTRIGSLVVNEYVALLGALGVLAGLAVTTSAERLD